MFSLECKFPLRTDSDSSDETYYDASPNVHIYETEVNDFVVFYVAENKGMYCGTLGISQLRLFTVSRLTAVARLKTLLKSMIFTALN